MTTRSSSESLPLGQETISRFTINKTKTTPGPTAEEVQAIIKAATAHEVLSDGNLQQSVESPEKKFHGMRKYGVAHDLSTFGTHLSGGLTTKRSDSSGYASGGSCSEFDSWGSFPGNQGLAALKEFHSHPDLTDRPQFGGSFRKILVDEVDIKNHKEMKEGKVKKGKKQPVVPEVEEPNPLDKVDCDTWFSEYTYGHLLPNTTPADVEYPTEEFINRLERRNRPPNFVKKVMPLLFGKSHKSPAEVVKNLREVLILVDKGAVHDKKLEKALEEISKNVSTIKAFIYGNDSAEPSSEHIIQVAQLAQEVYNANVLPMLVKLLPRFDFECKKDVGQIFNNLLRRQIGTRSPTVEYLGARPEILLQLVQGYSQPDIALTCGNMLRESIRHDHLAKIILYSDVFYTFFKYVQSEVFDIASDAFSTFKDLTTRHKVIAAEFLDANYDIFFGRDQYQSLLNSKNYVTRRQSLKLLGELLLDRHNFNIMTKYISNPDNMKLMMELLRDKSRNIQYEAFHVFKVFVANPNKPKPISDILLRNREKLVEFLGEFHNDRTDDEQFNDEKAYLVKQIQEMKATPKEPKKSKTEGAPESSEASPSPDQQQ